MSITTTGVTVADTTTKTVTNTATAHIPNEFYVTSASSYCPTIPFDYTTWSMQKSTKKSLGIKKVDLITDKQGITKGVIVTFDDGSKHKAICDIEDNFNLEVGFMICVAKRALQLAGFNKPTKELNNCVEKMLKQYTNQLIEKTKKEAEKAAIEYRKAKRYEKKKRRAERKEAAEKEKQIDIQSEAILRAMRQFDKEKELKNSDDLK